MTLIAAFRCGTPDDPSVVVCADSQETCGHYRVEVKKIAPHNAGEYDLIVGGSGEIGDLIDELSEYVHRDVSQWEPELTEESGRERLSTVLRTYHTHQVALYPASDTEKELRFIICVRDKQSGAIHLWQTGGTSVRSVRDYALIGWEEDIYKHQVKQFFRPHLSLAQTVLLGIDLISIGVKTSNYIGSPIQMIVARKEGMWADYPEDVKKLEERIERFNKEIGRFALACLDVSMPDAVFDKLLKRFEKQISLLRRVDAEQAIIDGHKHVPQTTKDDWHGFPYPKYSFDSLIDLLYGRERIKRAIAEAKEAEAADPNVEIRKGNATGWVEKIEYGKNGVPVHYHYKESDDDSEKDHR